MKAAVFSGTTEGREICNFLWKLNINTDVFVATEYGASVMPEYNTAKVFVGRLNEAEIEKIIGDYIIVIDATHPYAAEVSKNIKNACLKKSVRYIRLLRKIECKEEFLSFYSVDEAAIYLKSSIGNIFVSTGSKELEKYKIIDGFEKRIFGRCLDSEEVKKKCTELGFLKENFIFAKGPFTYEENIKAFKNFDIKILVTKQTGKNGGFYEKIYAADALGIDIIVIKPPVSENGFYMEEVKKIIKQNFS